MSNSQGTVPVEVSLPSAKLPVIGRFQMHMTEEDKTNITTLAQRLGTDYTKAVKWAIKYALASNIKRGNL